MKKTVLVIDDSFVNRAMLEKMLSDEYEVLQAADGKEGLEVLRAVKSEISAVLLDIMMPVMDGYEFLRIVRNDSSLAGIPLIVTTQRDAEEDELKALALGATDYLTKPYKPAIIKHRLSNIIEFREAAALVNTVERDSLTGLYNKDAFYRRARSFFHQTDPHAYDIVAVDIERFKLINDLFGSAEGDRLLHYLGTLVSDIAKPVNGLASRIQADHFVALLPHGELLEQGMVGRINEELSKYSLSINLILRFGIYPIIDSELPLQMMCDRAILAAKSISGKYQVDYAFYDDSLRGRMLDEQQLTNDMKPALEREEFVVYYQPKYDLSSSHLVEAEALVRWQHPERGLMTPDTFIPLFEKNGFITELDYYVWDTVCRNLRRWLDEQLPVVPISVNVSRVDIYNPELPSRLFGLLQRYSLDPKYLNLEITETAYTENPAQLVKVVDVLKQLGFSIEMDDFGNGYSSLSMLSELPIDTLKLDMHFLQSGQIGRRRGNILNFMVSLGKWLGLKVVAEGIETFEQVQFLRSMNCNVGQGYYFSRPLPQTDFERLMLDVDPAAWPETAPTYSTLVDIDDIWNPLSEFNTLFNAYIGALAIFEFEGESLSFIRGNDRYYEMIRIDRSRYDSGNLQILPWVHPDDRAVLLAKLRSACENNGEFVLNVRFRDSNERMDWRWLHVQMKVIYGDNGRLVIFSSMEDITTQKSLEKALHEQRNFYESIYDSATCGMGQFRSNAQIECVTANLAMVKMLGFESKAEFFAEPRDFIDFVDGKWREYLDRELTAFTADPDRTGINLEYELVGANGRRLWVHDETRMVVHEGEELYQCVLTDISALKQNERILLENAQKDVLTGILNRVAFNEIVTAELESNHNLQAAFMMLDVDNFKSINDIYGHAKGDEVLRTITELIVRQIREGDVAARYGGDEFVIFMRNIADGEQALNSANRICRCLHEELSADCGIDLETSISIGVALAPVHGRDVATLYERSDIALYRAKNSGKRLACLYEPEE